MIIHVDETTHRTYVRVRIPRCDGKLLKKDNVDILLRRCGLGVRTCVQVPVDRGCGDITLQKRIIFVQGPMIRYPAFDMDAHGRIGFLWDDKFLRGTPGRWEGELRFCESPIALLKFQLERKYAVDEVIVPVDECTT